MIYFREPYNCSDFFPVVFPFAFEKRSESWIRWRMAVGAVTLFARYAAKIAPAPRLLAL